MVWTCSSVPGKLYMEFFNSAVDVLQTLVTALGGGLGIWGVINLLEGYFTNPASIDFSHWISSSFCPKIAVNLSRSQSVYSPI